MAPIKKTILLLCFVFVGSFVALNFGYFSSELKLFLAERETSAASIDNTTGLKTGAYLFPIAADINPRKYNTLNDTGYEKTRSYNKEMGFEASLEIPFLNIKVPIIFEPTTNEDGIYKSLEQGVVHYSATPRPGQSGTAIILGHSSAYPWYRGKYGSVFSQISKLKNGDIINIKNSNGQVFSYRVSRSIIFSPKTDNDFELRELETTSGSSIVLMTCWPVGTNAKRIAVRADLI